MQRRTAGEIMMATRGQVWVPQTYPPVAIVEGRDAQPSRPSRLSSSNALKEFWMLFATTLSFGWPLLADAGSTRAVFAPFRNHPEMSARSVTFRLWPSGTVTGGTRTDSSLWLTSEVNAKAL